MKYLLLLFIISCGVDHRVSGVDNANVTVGPDFKKASELCDTRYGENTEASEACFLDYRNYTKIEIVLDFSKITEFCEDMYDDVEEINVCSKDLVDLLTGAVNNATN